MPIDLRRRDDIAAAVAAYDRDHPDALLPRNARLLAAMFAADDVCQRSLDDIAAEGFNRRDVSRMLRHLLEAGFLSKQPGSGRDPNTYGLHLPPRAQP
jgi:hypothetical protein